MRQRLHVSLNPLLFSDDLNILEVSFELMNFNSISKGFFRWLSDRLKCLNTNALY